MSMAFVSSESRLIVELEGRVTNTIIKGFTEISSVEVTLGAATFTVQCVPQDGVGHSGPLTFSSRNNKHVFALHGFVREHLVRQSLATTHDAVRLSDSGQPIT